MQKIVSVFFGFSFFLDLNSFLTPAENVAMSKGRELWEIPKGALGFYMPDFKTRSLFPFYFFRSKKYVLSLLLE